MRVLKLSSFWPPSFLQEYAEIKNAQLSLCVSRRRRIAPPESPVLASEEKNFYVQIHFVIRPTAVAESPMSPPVLLSDRCHICDASTVTAEIVVPFSEKADLSRV